MISQALLCVDKLSFAYQGQGRILDNIDITMDAGEMITLLGPNGAGKSTLLNCIVGILTPNSGRVFLNKKEIKSLSHREIARHIAYVSQSPSSNFAYEVREFIAMGRAPHLQVFQRPGKKDYEEVDQAMHKMGIEKFAHKIYTKLSGGERQMVNICQAIVQQPEIIIFDEPTSALDYGNQIKVLKIMKELNQEGYGIIMTTHNPEHPMLLGGKVCILDQDGGLSMGTTEEMMTQDRMQKIYRTDLKMVYVEEVNRKVCLTQSL